jgi:hypothetical protein
MTAGKKVNKNHATGRHQAECSLACPDVRFRVADTNHE